MPVKTEQGKNVTCTICQKKFSRTDHLKRHQLRHSGIKPYPCIFCEDAFTRSDNLRDHYPTCPQRRNRTIPDPARGGRKSHACDSCTSMKLGCDGNSPCKTCRQKGVECKFSRLLSKPNPQRATADGTSSKREHEHNPSSDRGSIKFLLNSGTASFIECFRFPSSNERKNIANFRGLQTESTDANSMHFFGNRSESGSAFSDPFEEEQIDWKIFEDENLLRFLSGPTMENQFQQEEIYAPVYLDPSFASHDQQLHHPVHIPEPWEPPSPQSAAISQAILDRTVALNLTHAEQADIHQHLNYLFIPSRIDKLVGLYFEYWHPHCPILHQPSFRIDMVPFPLLMPVCLMGAMYSPIDREVSSAKVLLDLSEMAVYSMDDLTDDAEIRHAMRTAAGLPSHQPDLMSPLTLQNLQTAFLMVCVQFWAGNPIARKRATEQFGIVVKVARKIGLHKARHDFEDGVDEMSWIIKESRIRLINVMTLLDCAFSFFANFPCRLTVIEMKFDLPCEEKFFASRNPFSEPNFAPSRKLTTYDAFTWLFPSEKSHLPIQGGKKNPLGLNPMDMFILIHLLYTYTHTHITQFSPSIPQSPSPSGSTTPTHPSSDSNATLIKAALSKWRSLWTTIRSSIPSHAWATLGFFRNGYNFWLVTQLLINNRGSVDVLMRMEVNCEDTLAQLRSLIKDG